MKPEVVESVQHIRRPLFQFWIVLEPFADVGVNVNIDKRVLNADLASNQRLESFFNVLLPATCG